MALTDNKAKIQALLAGINALPEAGSGEPAEPVLQEKAVTPTKAAQSVTPDTGFDGLSQVNVGAIPDEYIVPSGTVQITENGEHDVREAQSVNVNVAAPEITLQEKTVTPTTSAQTVEADSGYDGLSAVTVKKIPSDYVIPTGEKSITANGTHDVAGFASVNVAVDGGGESGGDIEMSTVTVIDASEKGYDVDYYYVSTETYANDYIVAHGSKAFNARKNSFVLFAIDDPGFSTRNCTLTGAEIIASMNNEEQAWSIVYLTGECTFQINY